MLLGADRGRSVAWGERRQGAGLEGAQHRLELGEKGADAAVDENDQQGVLHRRGRMARETVPEAAFGGVFCCHGR
jgi:hypothetical protein